MRLLLLRLELSLLTGYSKLGEYHLFLDQIKNKPDSKNIKKRLSRYRFSNVRLRCILQIAEEEDLYEFVGIFAFNLLDSSNNMKNQHIISDK